MAKPLLNREVTFKFKYAQSGKAIELFSTKGVATLEELVLGKEKIPYEDILHTNHRDRRLLLQVSPTQPLGETIAQNLVEDSVLVLEIYKANLPTLEKFIDRISSLKQVERKKEHLLAEGQGHLFRAATCPECESTIDLSGLDRSSLVYCRFCETVFKEKQAEIVTNPRYCICEECNLFDRVQGYTEFYFYFLVVVYGFSYNRRHLCDNCVNRVFRKALFLNLLFVLGIPSAIWIKIKSMLGRDRKLKQLAKANAFAKQGKYQQADEIYNQLYIEYPDHPGILMNQGLGHLFGNDIHGANAYFQRSLRSCKNYYPIMRLIEKIQAASEER